jgi:hypothetical protein
VDAGCNRATRGIHPRMGLHRALPRTRTDHHPLDHGTPTTRPRTRRIRPALPSRDLREAHHVLAGALRQNRDRTARHPTPRGHNGSSREPSTSAQGLAREDISHACHSSSPTKTAEEHQRPPRTARPTLRNPTYVGLASDQSIGRRIARLTQKQATGIGWVTALPNGGPNRRPRSG